MAAVTFNRLILNLASDPSIYRMFRLGSFDDDDGVNGEVRTLANGRERLIKRASGTKILTAVLRTPDADDRGWLLAHVGELVCVRDPDGGKFFGTYLTLKRSRSPGPVGVDISLSVRRISHSEAV